MTKRHFSRRDVLRSAIASLPLFASARVLGREGPGPNEKVNVAAIGLGGRCQGVTQMCLGIPALEIVAACDLFRPRVDSFLKTIGKGRNWKGYTDFLEMIDKENLDGVMVETTTHARAWVTCHAMIAGVDVYIEKPMALTVAEGRHVVQVARKYGRVTQVGTQQRSMPINNWASDLVKNGAIGKVKTVLAPNFIGPIRWVDQPAQPLPEGGSDDWWDAWTNQVVFRPYHVQLDRNWKPYWDYDGGGKSFGVTGWGTHSYDQVNRALGTDDTGPVEVVLEEPVAVSKSGRFEGPRAKVRMKFVGGTELRLHLDDDEGPGLGAVFVGDGGKIEINRNRVASNPVEIVETADNPGPEQKPQTQSHVEDWIENIKTRGRCTADIEIGQRSTTLCCLVNIARDIGRVGEVLKWDPQQERFTNCDEGNRMLSRPRRKGYKLPV